jgi:hypothetical protein
MLTFRLPVAIILLVLIPLLALAGPDTSPADHMGLMKFGEGKQKWFGLSIYTASLWGDSDSTLPEIYDNQVMLSINYTRDISSSRILETTRQEWKQLDGELDSREEAWIGYLAAFFPDINAGDQISSLVIPGEETRFYLGNEEIGRVRDAEFGPAFLAIWLDPNTSAKPLRTKLLRNVPTEKNSETQQQSISANL